MATFTNKKLANPILLTTASQVFYTVPSGKSTIVSALSLSNATGSVVTVSVHLVPNGSSPLLANALLPSVDMAARSIANFNFGQVLSAGDAIYASASLSNAISFHGSGIEIT